MSCAAAAEGSAGARSCFAKQIPMGGPDSIVVAPRTFPKSRRIQRPGEFAYLKAEGRREVASSLILNWMALTHPAGRGGTKTRLGVVTSRAVGGAVQRNRARRLLREAFRMNQHRLQQPALLVVVARQSIARKAFAAVERDFLSCLNRTGLTRPKPPTAGSPGPTLPALPT